MNIDGFLLIDKEEGWTSRDVCNKVAHLFNCKKSGHLGTLDPFATGLMIVALNEATKGLTFVDDQIKTYLAELVLGKKTSSGDKTNDVIEEKEIPELSDKDIIDVLNSFLGKSKQVPPMASAISMDGKRLYELFRQGTKIDVPPREIEVYDIHLISYHKPVIVFEVSVSKGTYIRTLGEDIANRLNTMGYLNSLRRIKMNQIDVSKAKKIIDLTRNDVIKTGDFLSDFLPIYVANESEEKWIKNGADITIDGMDDEQIAIQNQKGILLAVYGKIKQNRYHCLRGFNLENNLY